MPRKTLTAFEIAEMNELAEIMTDELNVKKMVIHAGQDEEGRKITIEYHHDTTGDDHLLLDCYSNGKSLGKPELAAWVFKQYLSMKN